MCQQLANWHSQRDQCAKLIIALHPVGVNTNAAARIKYGWYVFPLQALSNKLCEHSQHTLSNQKICPSCHW